MTQTSPPRAHCCVDCSRRSLGMANRTRIGRFLGRRYGIQPPMITTIWQSMQRGFGWRIGSDLGRALMRVIFGR